MVLPIYNILFFVFSAILIASAVLVIVARNPVYAVLFLVLAFFASALLWMMLQAEFLSLVLIFVYVGAVMTLFLFVVMMLNIDLAAMRERFMKFFPLGFLVLLVFMVSVVYVINPKHYLQAATVLPHFPQNYNNTVALGQALFTNYLYAFELAAVILLVAMISAVVLAFHGPKANTKVQRMSLQHRANKKDRLKIIKM